MPVGFDKITICNMALSHLGANASIADQAELTAAASPRARACNLWYDPSLIVSLEAFNWGFARKSLALTAHGDDAPTNRWAYRYQVPSDCIAPRMIENPAGTTADAVPFEVEYSEDTTLSIVTDQEDACLIYTRNLTDVDLFSMHFCEVMSYRLAMYMNATITGKMAIYNRVNQAYQGSVAQAAYMDTTGHVPGPLREASWIRARS